ncbi:addiction module toxin RelE [uncultured Enterococcus sp.]|uniref:addiction module toxin RelE n=1 Tax=uncultured Enterococcus sp. TaxID=167972 RepID=UPI002AA6103F|nr:addiction module toxin RelE [uncultured Enterococcus sp.]
MPTTEPRRTIAFSEDTSKKLAWLLEDEKRKRKKEKKSGQFHECHMLAQLIDNEFLIRKVLPR